MPTVLLLFGGNPVIRVVHYPFAEEAHVRWTAGAVHHVLFYPPKRLDLAFVDLLTEVSGKLGCFAECERDEIKHEDFSKCHKRLCTVVELVAALLAGEESITTGEYARLTEEALRLLQKFVDRKV